MATHNDITYLFHIRDAIARIEKYSKEITEKEFEKNELIQDAVIRQLEIIGEAVKQLSKSFTRVNNHINWKDIAGMRDKLIHDYLGVDIKLVWQTVVKDIPQLKKAILKLIPRSTK